MYPFLTEYPLEPESVPKTHGVHVMSLHMRSFYPDEVDFYCRFTRRVCEHLRIPCSNTVRLPTKTQRWTVPKSPFIDKKAQDQFERKHHKRLLKLWDANDAVLDCLVAYMENTMPASVGVRVERLCYLALDNLDQKRPPPAQFTHMSDVLGNVQRVETHT